MSRSFATGARTRSTDNIPGENASLDSSRGSSGAIIVHLPLPAGGLGVTKANRRACAGN